MQETILIWTLTLHVLGVIFVSPVSPQRTRIWASPRARLWTRDPWVEMHSTHHLFYMFPLLIRYLHILTATKVQLPSFVTPPLTAQPYNRSFAETLTSIVSGTLATFRRIFLRWALRLPTYPESTAPTISTTTITELFQTRGGIATISEC